MYSSRIFINYRREDSQGITGRIFDRLENHFGSKNIFIDVDSIGLGLDFSDVIDNGLRKSDIFLSIIGKNWLAVRDNNGRRIDNPDDFVRLEIDFALSQQKRIIPILVEGSSLPKRSTLPKELSALVRYNALRINHESFNSDVTRLIKSLEEIDLEKKNQKIVEKERVEKEKKRQAAAEKERLVRTSRLKYYDLSIDELNERLEMVFVKGGSFKLGKNSFFGGSGKVSKVEDFRIAKFLTRVDEYRLFCHMRNLKMPKLKPQFENPNYPIVNINWFEAVSYCEWISSISGSNFRLPSELEWEFAALGGNSSNNYKWAGSNKASEVAWYDKNSGMTSHAVGGKLPNELGLYDMSGNVYEWCVDDYNGQNNKVIRGGCWSHIMKKAEVNTRDFMMPLSRLDYIGFRIVEDLSAQSI